MKRIVVLGSTGSIGRQTLDVVRAFPQELAVTGLSAWSNRELLLQQAWEFRPPTLCCPQLSDHAALPPGCRLTSMEEMVTGGDVDVVMAATVGTAGLRPVLEALRANKAVALANKEAVVMAGELLMAEAQRHGSPLLPVDSEPSAIWQCLQGEDAAVQRLIITASGGAFRSRPIEELAHVTPEEALQHPTWRMGRKITVDSATLMNKGFEVIEAHWLFSMPWERIQVVVHPQSIIHSMVQFVDGSVKAQLSQPDMRLPIQYALFHPRRVHNGNLPRLDPLRLGALSFVPLDEARYPCFRLALEAGQRGGTFPAVLSAADEAAVGLFLAGKIGFLDIPRVVTKALDLHNPVARPTLEEILDADRWARETVCHAVGISA